MKAVKDFEGIYEISPEGYVLDLLPRLPHYVHPHKVLSWTTPIGYSVVRLWKNKKKYDKKLHRLLAMAFIPNPFNKRCVNHINGIKTDNRIENLEWCTHKENTQHAIKIGIWRNAHIKTAKQLDTLKSKVTIC